MQRQRDFVFVVMLATVAMTPAAGQDVTPAIGAGNNGTQSVSILAWDNLFNALNLGIGAAISILIFICVVIIAAIYIKGFGTAAPGTDTERR